MLSPASTDTWRPSEEAPDGPGTATERPCTLSRHLHLQHLELGEEYDHSSLRFVPRIVTFLGYRPLDASDMTLGQQVLTCHRIHGLRREDLAPQRGVDPSTLRSWENGSHQPTGKHRKRLEALLLSAGGVPPG
jgi:hypothetical protein